MARPTGPHSFPAPYPAGMTGIEVFDANDLPPLTQAIRDAWSGAPHPVASAAAIAALFAAVYHLETRVIELEA